MESSGREKAYGDAEEAGIELHEPVSSSADMGR